jgi:hypothetical protein
VAELDMDKEYLVLVTANAKGEVTGLRARDDPQAGRVVRLFSSKEKLDEYKQLTPADRGTPRVPRRSEPKPCSATP